MELSDDELREGERLLLLAFDAEGIAAWREWLRAHGHAALFAMARRAKRYDAAVSEHWDDEAFNTVQKDMIQDSLDAANERIAELEALLRFVWTEGTNDYWRESLSPNEIERIERALAKGGE